MAPGRIQHVSLNVGDAEEAGRFYEEVLGCERLPRPDFGVPGVWLAAGDTQIHLVEVPDHAPVDGPHFAFEVDDVEATSAELAAAGVRVSDVLDIPGAGRQVFFKDPAGNLIELNQPRA